MSAKSVFSGAIDIRHLFHRDIHFNETHHLSVCLWLTRWSNSGANRRKLARSAQVVRIYRIIIPRRTNDYGWRQNDVTIFRHAPKFGPVPPRKSRKIDEDVDSWYPDAGVQQLSSAFRDRLWIRGSGHWRSTRIASKLSSRSLSAKIPGSKKHLRHPGCKTVTVPHRGLVGDTALVWR